MSFSLTRFVVVEQLLANFTCHHFRDLRRHGVAEHPLRFGTAAARAHVFGELPAATVG